MPEGIKKPNIATLLNNREKEHNGYLGEWEEILTLAWHYLSDLCFNDKLFPPKKIKKQRQDWLEGGGQA